MLLYGNFVVRGVFLSFTTIYYMRSHSAFLTVLGIRPTVELFIAGFKEPSVVFV